MPISIINKPQALALVGEWLRKWRGEVGSGKLDSEARSEKSHFPFRSAATPASHIHHRTSGFPKIITTPNPEIIVAAQSDPALMEALQEADLSIPDGVGIVWALKILQGRRTKDEGRRQSGSVSSRPSAFSPQPSAFSRLSGIDLMEGMILQGYSALFLGGRPGVAAKAARKCYELWVMGYGSGVSHEGEFSQLTTHNSQLEIRALSGPQNISTISKSENDRLIAQINSFQPDLLFVAFGHPRQEKWLTENRERLTVGAAMAVGGAFDQLADPSLRPPLYINSIGLGWLYRLIRQPWRIKRQLALITFIYMVAKELFSRETREQ